MKRKHHVPYRPAALFPNNTHIFIYGIASTQRRVVKNLYPSIRPARPIRLIDETYDSTISMLFNKQAREKGLAKTLEMPYYFS